jgi:serpin B
VAAGAGGETLDEFLALLGAASRDELAEFAARAMPPASAALAEDGRSAGSSGGPVLALACGVWYQNTVALKPAYRAAAVESYKAKMRAADFIANVSQFTGNQSINHIWIKISSCNI